MYYYIILETKSVCIFILKSCMIFLFFICIIILTVLLYSPPPDQVGGWSHTSGCCPSWGWRSSEAHELLTNSIIVLTYSIAMAICIIILKFNSILVLTDTITMAII